MIAFGRLLCTISTEDAANQVFDPVRVGIVAGGAIYLFGGVSIIVMGLHTVWFTATPIDYSSFGIGLAAWGGGLGAVLAGAGGGLLAKAHADATGDTVKVIETLDNPPDAPVKKTTTTETEPPKKGKR